MKVVQLQVVLRYGSQSSFLVGQAATALITFKFSLFKNQSAQKGLGLVLIQGHLQMPYSFGRSSFAPNLFRPILTLLID